MPTYDYRCDTNNQTVEVTHRMNELMSTWGELCERAGIAPGDTAKDSPVSKLATGGNLVSKSNMGSGIEPACNTGGCCAGGMCGLD
jgi:hypothetical protein